MAEKARRTPLTPARRRPKGTNRKPVQRCLFPLLWLKPVLP